MDKNRKVIIPKYDLGKMFSDDKSVDYKLGCKYDLQFESEIDYENRVGLKIGTRSPDVTRLQDQR